MIVFVFGNYYSGTKVDSHKLVLHPYDALVMRSGAGMIALSMAATIAAVAMQLLW